jgi:hypothetical protein
MTQGSLSVLMVNYEYPPLGGGGGVMCRDVAEGLAGRGHRVGVLTSAYRHAPAVERVNGVEIRRVPVLMRQSRSVASLASMLSFVLNARGAGVRWMRLDPPGTILPARPACRMC